MSNGIARKALQGFRNATCQSQETPEVCSLRSQMKIAHGNHLFISSGSTAHGLYEAMLGNSHAFQTTIASGSQEAALIMSSQEEPEQQKSSNALLPTIQDKTSTKASWFDPSHNAMVRSLSTSAGQVVVASMEPGKDGFCVATFPGEKPFVTEMPNVLVKKSSTAEHTGKGMKRPAALKKPAALSSKRPAPALQEPAPDNAATATHEPQAEEELPVSCLIFFDKYSNPASNSMCAFFQC